MDQLSFATLDFAGKKKRTKRDVFVAEMASVVPWSQLEAVIEGADRAMYEAKAQGRNCSVINSVESAVEPRVAADVVDADTRGQ